MSIAFALFIFGSYIFIFGIYGYLDDHYTPFIKLVSIWRLKESYVCSSLDLYGYILIIYDHLIITHVTLSELSNGVDDVFFPRLRGRLQVCTH